MSAGPTERAELEARLKAFTVALAREVGMRTGHYAPVDAKERSWKLQGPVEPLRLTTVQEQCGVG